MRKLLLLAVTAAAAFGADIDLRVKRLGPSYEALDAASRAGVNRAVQLIKKSQHTAALAVLTELSRAHPGNSSLKVALAYGLLQAGNLVGAFDRAREAETLPDHNSYVCLFLARVAYLVGDSATCRREVAHVRQAGEHRREADALERKLVAQREAPHSGQ